MKKRNFDFESPFEVDKLLEIRTSAMKTMPGLTIKSGIDKKICATPMKINKLGLEGDEHDPTFHGGPDKAILGYCASHYPDWKESYPEQADKFVPGGFGENFVTEHMNERNVCIGDVISVGEEVLLQVSLPRMPCFKLNHRFSLKNFAPEVYKSSRTGWYYRVMREGTVHIGDELRLVERSFPDWTIERIQQYLHRETDNLEMNKKLAEIEVLGEESRGQFRNRVAKAKKKTETRKEEVWREFKVVSRAMETKRVVCLTLETNSHGDSEPTSVPGAHARLKLPNGLIRTYSIVSGDNNKFQLGVALDENGRGGSRYLHDNVQVGTTIEVGRITTDIKPNSAASNHVFVIGGIGITAFLSLMKAMDDIHLSIQLHYAVRSSEDIAFADHLEQYGGDVKLYDKSKGERMDIKHIIKNLRWNSHVYTCGPPRMLQAVSEAVSECGIPPSEVHYEAFTADTSGDPFEVEVTNRGEKMLQVGGEETLLEVLRKEFDDIPSSCEVGNCGTCKLTLKSGQVDHRGSALSPEDKTTAMLACVSRGIGRIVIEI